MLDALERAGGSATVAELAARVGVKRPRDLRRRALARLEQAEVVQCSDEMVSLVPDWRDALEDERERAGEIEAARRQRERNQRDREEFLAHLLRYARARNR